MPAIYSGSRAWPAPTKYIPSLDKSMGGLGAVTKSLPLVRHRTYGSLCRLDIRRALTITEPSLDKSMGGQEGGIERGGRTLTSLRLHRQEFFHILADQIDLNIYRRTGAQSAQGGHAQGMRDD